MLISIIKNTKKKGILKKKKDSTPLRMSHFSLLQINFPSKLKT